MRTEIGERALQPPVAGQDRADADGDREHARKTGRERGGERSAVKIVQEPGREQRKQAEEQAEREHRSVVDLAPAHAHLRLVSHG